MMDATFRSQMSSASGETRLGASEPGSDGRLDSWKEIAAYLRRSVRSAKRWEKEQQLPVHRHHHDKRDSVYAYRAELDGWWENRGAKLTDQNGVDDAASLPEIETLDRAPSGEEPEREEGVAPPASPVPRRAALIGVGFGLAIVLVGVVAWLARNGSSPSASSLRPLPFKARDWVLIADFENRTGEPLLDGTLEYALARELSNSRYVNVVPRARIGDALRLMRKPLDTRVDASVGREVCLRDGQIRALLTGRVEKFGAKYLLSVNVVEPTQGTRVNGFTEESAGKEGSLTAVRQISDRVRKALGETLPSDSGQTPLVKVTTSNLRALQLYSRADSLMSSGLLNSQAAAEELLRQAVTEDPNFASAYMHLAHAINNQRRPAGDFRPYAETALRLSESTTERERLFIRGSYYALLGQREKAIAAFEALLSLYPDDFWGAGNLAGLYASEGRVRDGLELEVRRADLRPWDFQANQIAASDLAPLDRIRSRLYFQRARALISPAAIQEHPGEVEWLELFPAAEDWLDGNPTRALQVANGLAAKIDPLSGSARASFAMGAAYLYLTLGRLEAAAQCFQKIPDPLLRQEQLARVAFFRNDRRALEQHLMASEGSTYLSANTVILLVRVGLLPRAARLLNTIETSQTSISDPGFLQIPRGELALARGEVDSGIAELEEGTRSAGMMGYWVFLGSESLAAALKKKGDLAQAVQVLERASEKRSSAAFEGGGACWLRTQLQLARLYRETGRERDARAIEEELRKLLSLADPDHPIRRELDRLKGS